MSGCYRLITTYTEISNNRYIFNNDYTNISFGLYNNSNNNYLIKGVPKNYPLTFYSQQGDNISNIISFEPINSEPIFIYVSKGQDVSFNNGDYFRFYDTSYQLLNINHGYRRTYDSSLTDIRSNFYFMNNRSYKFIAIRDFCSNFPFHIGSNSLTFIDNSFTLTIPDNANNSSNKIFYRDNTNDISGNLYILKDLNGLQYNYGDISFSISNYSNIGFNNIKISIKSYDFSYGSHFSNFGNKEISNNNYLYYSPICDYIINNSLALNNEYLNKVSAIDISIVSGSLLCSFNKGRHLNSNNNVYDLSFVLTDGSYIIIDVPLNYPLRLLNNNVSSSIYIDTSYQPTRIKSYRNSTNNQVYYHGSFKIKVLANFSIVGVEIYNRLTNNPTSFNSKFIYTNNNHSNNNGTYGTVNNSVLRLKNQKDIYYVLDQYNAATNIYNLKLDEKYVEKGYIALDKYGNDLAINKFVKVVPSSLESIDREITNTINNRLSAYNILYEVRDYEDNLIQNIRKIEINYGPIIEISSNYFNTNNIYINSNQNNNTLIFQNNTFNILQDICFVDVRTIQNYGNFISSYVYNTPIIEYRDNSTYDLNYTRDILFTIPVNSNISIENNVVALLTSQDTSCIILYRGKDICNNLSQDISLVLNFVSIPKVELSGNIVLDISYISHYTSYKDSGIKIYRNNDNIDTNFIFFDPPQGITRNVSYSTSIPISSTTYDISYITDLCQNLIGNYYFNYTIRIQNNTSSYPLNLRRLVRIIDNERPSFLFHDLSLISYKLNATNMTNYDSNYRNFPNRRIAYTNSNFNIDLSFTINRTFDDLSKVLYDFSATDNYFSPSTILPQIRLINNYTPLTYNDISNYFNNEKRFNKVTVGTANTLPPLTFIYTISDLCSNIATAQRIVNIIDDSLPSIDFSFNNYYNSINNPNYNYKYVYFNPSSYTDFSYVAFNYGKSNTTFNFIQELSSILFNYNLSDTFSNGNINYRITISNDSIQYVINNVSDLSANATVKSLFSAIDTSFTIVYDISDNQYNTSRTTRKVKIIDLSYNLDISFLNNSRNLTISFGDTGFNILQDVSFNHRRLTSSNINFDISYNFTSTTITTVSGASSIIYDPAALIYNVGIQTVNYFPRINTSTNYSIERYINVTNYGPIINYLPSGEIIHEVYTPITDASLLFNVTSDSIYDRFYYQNNKHPLVYNGTNFKVTYDTSLNLLGPSFGTYNIFYNSRDLNGVNTSKRRSLRVIDSSPPNLTLSGDSIYNIIGNTYYIPNGKYYIEHGAYGYDVGSRTYIPDISISKVYERNTNIYPSGTPNFVTISYEYFNTYQLIFSENIVNYRITYRATDICNNRAEIIRNIIVSGSKKPILEPYIEVSDMCNNVRTYPLSSDISINSQLRNTLTNTLTNTLYDSTIYDLSLVSSNSAQYILCEAVLQNVFYKVKTNNYIKFLLNAKKYDGTPLNSEYKNVDYSINSIDIYEDQTVTFFARDISRDPIDQISFIEYTLRFIDSKPPLVNLLGNKTFENINILNYPLLKQSTINKLANVNINYFDNFNNIYNNYERYYKKSLDNYIVIVDPGINITDIVHGRVNYINGAFSSVINYQHTFDITDISINYNRLNQSYYIDVCNLLIEDTCYNQNYRVSDRNQNIADISRIINVSRFPPIINLNYQADCCNNKYITHLHKLYEIYQDLGGNVKDYFDDTINFANVVITNNINENQTGTYNILYDVSNSAPLSNRGVRNVEVINTLQLQENLSYNFSDISNPSNNTKYSLANGIYKLDVSINNAFNIIVREFDISLGNYDISNIVSITSDNSLNNSSSNKKYYYNNVVLTISGDFNRLSLEFANNQQPTIRNMFVYNNENSYLDVANHIENTKNNVFIHKSYDLDISNLNVLPNIKPFYVLNDTLNNSAVNKNFHYYIQTYYE